MEGMLVTNWFSSQTSTSVFLREAVRVRGMGRASSPASQQPTPHVLLGKSLPVTEKRQVELQTAFLCLVWLCKGRCEKETLDKHMFSASCEPRDQTWTHLKTGGSEPSVPHPPSGPFLH